MLNVVKLESAAGLSQVSESPLGDAGFGTVLVRAKHRTPAELVELVRPLLTAGAGKAEPLGKSGSILISDTAARLAQIQGMLDRLDAPDTTIVREVPLRFLDAAQVLSSISAINARRGEAGGAAGGGAGGRRIAGEVVAAASGRGLLLIIQPEAEDAWRDLITSLDQRETVTTQTYQPRYFGARDVAQLLDSVFKESGGAQAAGDDRFRVVADELTESLIITATAPQHERVKELLTRLDADDRGPTPVRSFPVRNRPVGELLSTLKELIDAGALDASSAGEDSADRVSVSEGASQRHEREPPLPPGTQANGAAPLLPQRPAAKPPRAAGASSGSSKSRRAPLTLTADESTNTLIAIGEPRLIVQLQTLIAGLDVRQPQVMLEAMLVSLSDTQTVTFGVELDRLASLGNATLRISSLFGLGTPATGSPPPVAGTGFTGAVLNPGEFALVVRALESVNAGNSLSHPQILVANNHQAQFSSTIQQPIRQLTRSNTSDQTFSYGGTESAGTTISVKPQIAQGDHLVLTYAVTLSSFIGTSSDPGVPPPKQDNSVNSVAAIPDGHTVVVGGLELINDSNAQTGLPFLSRIPILGHLLGTTSNNSGRTRFYVFIKATVLRSSSLEDLKYVSALKSEELHIDDSLPTLEPAVMK